MKLCIDQETTRRLNKFFTAKNEDRCISLTNLKLGSLTLPAHEGCSGGAPTSKEIALIVGGGRVRILTDISNHVEWDIFQQLISMKNVEIRHYRYLEINLFLIPKQSYSLTLVRDHYGCGYFDDELISFESKSNDKKNKSLFERFEKLWSDAERINEDKLRVFIRLAENPFYFLFKEKPIPSGTYLLITPKDSLESLCDGYGVFNTPLEYQWEKTNFSCIAGLDIPSDAKYIIFCKLYHNHKHFFIRNIFKIDVANSSFFDEIPWELPSNQFMLFLSNAPSNDDFDDNDFEFYPIRMLKFEKPSSDEKNTPSFNNDLTKCFMLSNARCKRRDKNKLAQLLDNQYKTNEEFRQKVLEKSLFKIT
jgi:hypothetical protein